MAVKYLKADKKYKKSKFTWFTNIFKLKKSKVIRKITSPNALPNLDKDSGLGTKKISKKVASAFMIITRIFLTIAFVAGVIFVLAYFNFPANLFKRAQVTVFANARLVVNTEFIKANVLLDKQDMGQTPLDIADLGEGKYSIHLIPLTNEKKFFTELNIPVILVGGRTTVVKAQIGPTERTSSYSIVYSKPKEGVDLVVKTTVPGVKVFLDDKEIGLTPLVKTNIDAGEHTIKLESNGYRTITLEIDRRKDETVYIEAKLYEYVLNEN